MPSKLVPHYGYSPQDTPPILGQFSAVWQRDNAAWAETLRIEPDAEQLKVYHLRVYNPLIDAFENADEENSAYAYDRENCPDRMHGLVFFTIQKD